MRAPGPGPLLPPPRRARGFSLLEMLIAFAIFSAAFGTLFTLFGQGVTLTVGNREYTVALHLVEDLLHRQFVEIDKLPAGAPPIAADHEDITAHVEALYPGRLNGLPGLRVHRTVRRAASLPSGGYEILVAARWGGDEPQKPKRRDPRHVELYAVKAVRR